MDTTKHPRPIKSVPQSLVTIDDNSPCLESTQLEALEESFRTWAASSTRVDVSLSRKRILFVFLLIRYTGAKLNEVLALDPFADIDGPSRTVRYLDGSSGGRRVEISEPLCREFLGLLSEPEFRESLTKGFSVDQGFVRRKFYERAEACGFEKTLCGPEMIRRARAVELMQNNLPIPVVQTILGHSTPNLTSAYVTFTDEEIHRVTRLFVERESTRKTSARNSFFGKITAVEKGDIQCRIELTTLGGHTVTTMITNDSLTRLGLKPGVLISAEVKAPWVILHAGPEEPRCSAENRFSGTITRINRGRINTEYTARISDGTELCAIVSTLGGETLSLKHGDTVWMVFNAYAVVLHAD
jgi:molybdate transport system regulatory protein